MKGNLMKRILFWLSRKAIFFAGLVIFTVISTVGILIMWPGRVLAALGESIVGGCDKFADVVIGYVNMEYEEDSRV